MAVDWRTSPKSEQLVEVTLGAANTFTELKLPNTTPNLYGRAVAIFLYSTSSDVYYCLSGSDGGVRGTEARHWCPAGQWNRIFPTEGSSIYIANTAGSAVVSLHAAPAMSTANSSWSAR